MWEVATRRARERPAPAFVRCTQAPRLGMATRQPTRAWRRSPNRRVNMPGESARGGVRSAALRCPVARERMKASEAYLWRAMWRAGSSPASAQDMYPNPRGQLCLKRQTDTMYRGQSNEAQPQFPGQHRRRGRAAAQIHAARGGSRYGDPVGSVVGAQMFTLILTPGSMTALRQSSLQLDKRTARASCSWSRLALYLSL